MKIVYLSHYFVARIFCDAHVLLYTLRSQKTSCLVLEQIASFP